MECRAYLESINENSKCTPPINFRYGENAKRNDPCPCLSGLKFKKCCINLSAHNMALKLDANLNKRKNK
jgi:hypothetical protein